MHRPAYRQFCLKLRKWREQAGLTQRVLARKLGIAPSIVHKTEVGERRMDPLEFISWCRACGGEPSESLGEVEREIGFGRRRS